MTMDLWKKPQHHNETIRKYGSTRGLTELPQEAAAELTEEYFSGQGVPLRSWSLKPKLGSPA